MARVEHGLVEQALVEESAKKSGLVWVSVGGGPARALWHVWHEGAVHVVGDGAEQPLRGLVAGAAATVVVRSKDKGGRVVAWPAHVEELTPGTEAWRAAATALAAKRLNAPTPPEALPAHWTTTSHILRLTPSGPPTESPSSMPTTSHTAPPTPTPATTRNPKRP
jgi:hypothetical protein